ncbi:Flp pilus assembly protein CpaB [Arthrobacter sp. TMT4-20]
MALGKHPPRHPQRAGESSHRVGRFVFRNRRLLAAMLFCLATAVAVEALIPPEQTRVGVVAAAADLPVGTVLTAAHLTIVELPAEAVMSASFADPSEVVGEQLATPLPHGFVLTPTAFVGSGLLTGAPAGTVAVPLRPSDPSTVQLLSPGHYVEVVLSTGNGFDVPGDTTVLARGLPVLWTSATPSSGPSGVWPGNSESEGLVVVAAAPADAAALAGASSTGNVHLVLTGAPPG